MTDRLTLRHGSGPHARAALAVAGHVHGASGVSTVSDEKQRGAAVEAASGARLASGVTAAVRLLVRASPDAALRGELLPSAPAALAAVERWLSALNRAGAPAVAPRALSELNAALLGSAFLAGPRLTAADLAWFGAVAPQAAEAAKGRPHLARWLRHVRDTTGAAALLERVPDLAPPAAEASPAAELESRAAAPSVEALLAWMDGEAPAGFAFEGLGKVQAGSAFGAAGAAKKKKKKEKKAKAAPAKAGAGQPDVWKVDLRVGRIVAAEKHANADKLFVLRVDVGEAEPRTVVAGLVGFFEVDALAGLCTVLCNVPAGDMQGVESNGRMLVATAADDPSKKVIVAPPADAKVGERVAFEGVTEAPEKVVKKKQLNKLLKGFATGDGGVAQWGGLAFQTSAGVCVAEGVSGGTVA